eukprot:GHVS01090314.1.p1 GENE.GHVS01090314.1~~GHVS01090314.1.p1  ORF type:complete len:141 (+),score=61.07 GHVS01090314.1:56-478(+)
MCEHERNSLSEAKTAEGSTTTQTSHDSSTDTTTTHSSSDNSSSDKCSSGSSSGSSSGTSSSGTSSSSGNISGNSSGSSLYSRVLCWEHQVWHSMRVHNSKEERIKRCRRLNSNNSQRVVQYEGKSWMLYWFRKKRPGCRG